MATCKVCPAISGEKRISPGNPIYVGKYWIIEHAYPVSIRGWLVLVCKRHVTALHELTAGEVAEEERLAAIIIKTLHGYFQCDKEYRLTVCEGEGFSHLHTHFVPITPDIDPDTLGKEIFCHIGDTASHPIPTNEIKQLCVDLANRFVGK